MRRVPTVTSVRRVANYLHIKTCVTCLASFCKMHLMPHTESQALKKHCLCAPVIDIRGAAVLEAWKSARDVLHDTQGGYLLAVLGQTPETHHACSGGDEEKWKASIDPVAEEAQNREDATGKAFETLETLSEGLKAAAEKMKEDVELRFETLRDTIERAQHRVIAFMEAEKEGALQQTEEQTRRLDDHMLVISRLMDQINQCRSNDSYFNFCLSLPQLPPQVRQLHGSDVQLDGRAMERIVLDLQNLNSSLESQLRATLTRREHLRDEGKTILLGGQHYREVSPPEDIKSNWAVGATYKTRPERYQSLGRDKSSWCVRWQNAGKTENEDENSQRTEEVGELVCQRRVAEPEELRACPAPERRVPLRSDRVHLAGLHGVRGRLRGSSVTRRLPPRHLGPSRCSLSVISSVQLFWSADDLSTRLLY
ncbi:hypothetical protein SRHO_G00201340 [Serrasalmus rhombeus]